MSERTFRSNLCFHDKIVKFIFLSKSTCGWVLIFNRTITVKLMIHTIQGTSYRIFLITSICILLLIRSLCSHFPCRSGCGQQFYKLIFCRFYVTFWMFCVAWDSIEFQTQLFAILSLRSFNSFDIKSQNQNSSGSILNEWSLRSI